MAARFKTPAQPIGKLPSAIWRAAAGRTLPAACSGPDAPPRIIAYLNRGEQPFERRVLAEGHAIHEMHLLREGAAGAWTLFAADEIQPRKFPQMRAHLGVWKILPPAKPGRGLFGFSRFWVAVADFCTGSELRRAVRDWASAISPLARRTYLPHAERHGQPARHTLSFRDAAAL